MTGAVDPGRNALMLTELRLPTIGQLWPELARRSDKEGWPAGRFLGALLEHELAERAKRRTERHRAESQLDPTKTLASFDFAEVPMLSKAHVMALAGGDAWLDKGATVLIFGPLVWARATSVAASATRLSTPATGCCTCAPANWFSACRPPARACSCPRRWPSSTAMTC